MKNTWLSFILDNDTRELMFNINNSLDSNKINVMDYYSIHMTAVFFGKRLKGLNKETLKDINDCIITIITEYSDTIKLEFNKFELFPPDKKNMVVALYKPNKVLTSIILKIKKQFPELCDKTEEFIAHITMGKIVNGEEIDLNSIDSYPSIEINGLELCGDKIKYIDNRFLFNN